MSDNLIKVFPELQVLQHRYTEGRLRNLILRDPIVLLALREIVYNILKNNIKLPREDKRKIYRHGNSLAKIVEKKPGSKRLVYQTFSTQKGGALLGVILSAVLPLLSSLIHHSK